MTASDRRPAVLATGNGDVARIFASLSARESSGHDADYLRWHSLDHRPEQHRLPGLRQSLRVVSTPACRSARAFCDAQYDAVDHVMTYFLSDSFEHARFRALSDALDGERRPYRLPGVSAGYFNVAGKLADPSAMAGADVLPWRPTTGVYLLVERGRQSPAALLTQGVAGIWWHEADGVQLSYCFLDEPPIEVADRLRSALEQRWSDGTLKPLLAAPFHTIVPFEWERYLP